MKREEAKLVEVTSPNRCGHPKKYQKLGKSEACLLRNLRKHKINLGSTIRHISSPESEPIINNFKILLQQTLELSIALTNTNTSEFKITYDIIKVILKTHGLLLPLIDVPR